MRITSDRLIAQATSQANQKDLQLVDAAQQFEAMLMQEMLKPMRAGPDDWCGEKSDDSAAETISSFGTEAIAKAISRAGGLGIATQVIRQVRREHERIQK